MNKTRDVCMLLRLLIFITIFTEVIVEGNVVFNVQQKFGGLRNASLADLKNHDMVRRGRSLATINVPMGGDAKFTTDGLYYTMLSIGSPAKDFHLQIDTGSNIMWVNCAGCKECATKSDLGFDHAFFDAKASSTSESVTCEHDFCVAAHNGPYANCTSGKVCDYLTTYLDGSEIGGYFVKDNVRFNQASGDLQTKPMDASIAFGCSSKNGGNSPTSTDQVDGIVGFGPDDSSIISQLASSHKINKVFSHCFDGSNGGGIFAIGQILEPQVTATAKLIPDTPHYTITMMTIDVGGQAFELDKGFFGIGSGMDAVVDSGATLAFFPQKIYDQLIANIMGAHKGIETYTYEKQFTCFKYEGDVSADFPLVTMKFMGDVTLKVHPTEYLIQIENKDWCLGWQVNAKDDSILLGDLALANKLVTYDLEKQVIGFTEHDCSKEIKVKDVETGGEYLLQGGDISPPSSSTRNQYGLSLVVLIISAMLYHFTF